METLMGLIDKAEIETEQKINENKLATGNMLKDLGFTKTSENILSDIRLKEKVNKIVKYKYLKVTESMINGYLDTKVENYNKEHIEIKPIDIVYGYGALLSYGIPFSLGGFDINGFGAHDSLRDLPKNKIIFIKKRTCDFNSREKNTIGQFIYKECPIDTYEGIPPKEVLDKLRIHKDRLLFDYFTIASVENVKDPLLFGRINESTDRYFIAQWGEDILLDDLV